MQRRTTWFRDGWRPDGREEPRDTKPFRVVIRMKKERDEWPVDCYADGGVQREEEPVILSFNFEELRALETGTELFLSGHSAAADGPVAAPSAVLADVERFKPRLAAAISVNTLADQRALRNAVAAICGDLHERLEEMVIRYHPAHEEAVALYFDYAHVFGVLTRLDEMSTEMSALIELMTGTPVSDDDARTVSFPD